MYRPFVLGVVLGCGLAISLAAVKNLLGAHKEADGGNFAIRDNGRRQADALRFLTSQRLRLVYQDAPLGEALADFKKKSGCNLVLHDPDKALARRRLTLDTGEATFWEALDRFCAKAGLVEVETVPTSESRSAHWVARFGIAPAPRRGFDQTQPPQNSSSEPIMLQARPKGGRQALATHYVGPFRLRVVPPPNQKKDPGIALPLELALQPGFGIAKIAQMRIDEAVDDQNQSLQPSSDRVVEVDTSLDALHHMQKSLGKAFEAFAGVGKVVVNVNEIHDEKYRNFSFPFHKGGRPSRSLKKVKGTLSVLIMPPAETCVRVSDVFRAVGRLVEGEQGTAVKVLDVVRHVDGRIRLHLELTVPDLTVQGALDKAPQNFSYHLLGPLGQLNMEDDQGVLPVESFYVEEQKDGKPNIAELWATFRPAAGRRPTKLAFYGRRCVALPIPFVLKDAPLQ